MDVSNSKDDEAIYKVLGRCEVVKDLLCVRAGCWLLAAGCLLQVSGFFFYGFVVSM